MIAPSDLGYKANPFPQHGVPPQIEVPFAAYPSSDLHIVELRKWLRSIYDEGRPSCYIFVGDFGSGKSHLKNVIRDLASRDGYLVKEEIFGTSTSLYSTICSTSFRQDRTLVLLDEVQKLYDTVRRNRDAIADFKVQLRSFLEGKMEAETEPGFANVTVLLFCTPQVKNVILAEEDMSQRFMLTVKSLPPLDPYIGLNAAKNFLSSYAEEVTVETRLRANPYYPFDRYTVLSLINLTPYVVEKEGGTYDPTTRFLVELLRHCFDFVLKSDLDRFTYEDLQNALKETNVLEKVYDLSPSTYKLLDLAKSPRGKTIALFLGTALGWWTIPDISRACGISFDEAKKVLHQELSSVINAEQCWIIGHELGQRVRDEIRRLGKRYEDMLADLFSLKWVTPSDDPCYLVVPSLHLIDERIERVFRRFGVRREDIYWLRNSFEVFHVNLEGKFKRFSTDQLDAFRKFLEADSLHREQVILGQLRLSIQHATLKEVRDVLRYEPKYSENTQRILGLSITPHASAETIYYRAGLRFLSPSASGIIDPDFRSLLEWLKGSVCDFLIVLTFPENIDYRRLEPFMREEVKWAPANKRIFIKSLDEADLATILVDPEGFSVSLESLVLDAIRDFNEGMLSEYLLMPLYGLRWAQSRLNPNHSESIYPKLRDKWSSQVLESMDDAVIREFLKANYDFPAEAEIGFQDGEVIEELFDDKMTIKLSEYELKVYRLIEDHYQIERATLEADLEKSFVCGALYKITQAKLDCYQFVVERLLAAKNLVRISPEFDSSGQRREVVRPRRIPEEKQAILAMNQQIRKNLFWDFVVSFDRKKYVFSNRKYVSPILDRLRLIDQYVTALPEPDSILEKAMILTQLSYLQSSIQGFAELSPTQLQKGQALVLAQLTNILEGVQRSLDGLEGNEAKISAELERRGLTFTPKSCVNMKKQVGRRLSRIRRLVGQGRLLEMVGKEAEKIHTISEEFYEQSNRIASMLSDADSEVRENNERYQDLKVKKNKVGKLGKRISSFALEEYAAATPVTMERNFIEESARFLKSLRGLPKPKKIRPKEAETLCNSLRTALFSKVLERYETKIRSVLHATSRIDDEYNATSSEYMSKSEAPVSKLSSFWSNRIAEIDELVQAAKNSADGLTRLERVAGFYGKIINTVGATETAICHAIAFEHLDRFLFLRNIGVYAQRMGMKADDISQGIASLSKARILKQGFG